MIRAGVHSYVYMCMYRLHFSRGGGKLGPHKRMTLAIMIIAYRANYCSQSQDKCPTIFAVCLLIFSWPDKTIRQK